MATDKLALLNRLIARCRNSSFYRQRLPDRKLLNLNELKKIPLITKEDLRKNSPFGLLCVPKQRLLQYHESFGTTGMPVSVWLTRKDMDQNAWAIAGLGVQFNQNDVVLIRYPYAISGVAHMVHSGAQLKKSCVIPASSRTTVSPFSRIVGLLRKLDVTILACLPQQAVLLAETAEIMGFDPKNDFPCLRAVCTAGEPMPPGKRRLISKIWGVPVYDNYGMTEIGPLVLDCEYHTPHPLEDNFIIEILDDNLQDECEPGKIGNLVVTTLKREASPMLRLLTGDRARMCQTKCSCGQTSCLEIRGRESDTIKINGQVLDLFDLDDIISHLPCRRFWAAVPEQDLLHLLVEKERDGDKVPDELAGNLEKKYGIPFLITIVPKGTLFDRSELLTVKTVGKPRYIFTAREMKERKHLLSIENMNTGERR